MVEKSFLPRKPHVMVNGLPGNMASKVAQYIAATDDLELLDFSLTGPEIEDMQFNIGPTLRTATGGRVIELIKPKARKDMLYELARLPYFSSVDFTNPDAVNMNGEFYCDNGLDFVIGTTGGDRKLLEDTVKKSQSCAVIAPNMAKQIVAFQAMMQYAAETFPDAFKGYTLEIVESHQKGKKDTSGTAKAMVGYFSKLGIPFAPEQIKMIREPNEQMAMGIPEDALSGHGWHEYSLKSEDGTVLFRFTHNVNGRDVYAVGTLDAIRYLDRKVHEGNRGQVYSMIDVLKGK